MSVWREWGGVVLVAFALVPVAALVAAGLAALRMRRGASREIAWRHSAAEIGMLITTAPWVWMILTPRDAPGQVFLIPFSDLPNQLAEGAGFIAYQVGGNLLVFAGLGALAPIRWAVMRGVGRLLLLGAACSATVEILQYALDLGRVSSVDDVLVNATGVALAALASRPWWTAGDPARINDRSVSA
ncbi:VanZ family protein [Catenuloplanes japonicus]|uniref:VanZ family protein n=1 Tax=Catenuloplanes japonicus TaxID=33876 RepID=UPI000524BA6D|nr:VanZ family protein [Catenuloplanes japonicus]